MNRPTETFVFDDLVGALANIERRRLLVALLDQNQSKITTAMTIESSRSMDEDTRFVGLYHVHLPKLADQGFIEWDKRRQEIRRGPQFERIQPVLELLEANRTLLPRDYT